MNSVSIQHNGDTHQYNLTDGATAGDLKTDRELQSALGVGSNVDVVVNGSVVDDSYTLKNGQSVSFRTRASSKA